MNEHPATWAGRQSKEQPAQNLALALARLEAVAYAKGVAEGLSRLEMLAAIVPESVTKKQLVEMIGREAKALIANWNKQPKPQ